MLIYTFQSKEVLDEAISYGMAFVDYEKTNFYYHAEKGADLSYAYLWMAGKLCEKTGIWQQDIHTPPDTATFNENGDMVFEDGEKVPLLPFWGWYLVDGKNIKPGMDYCFDFGNGTGWNHNPDTILIELEIPDKYVLLSDANAWYCVLEMRPCYEYESRTQEAFLLNKYTKSLNEANEILEEDKKKTAFDALYKELTDSWDNIFRLKGRRLRKTFPFGKERRDVQAVFPYIDKKWIRNTWECR